ncbi:MAG: mycothiol conjugate amidase Mca [Lawsonella sp.]|nr:mycothiol conjugate amidase Mca [Mycobacteriales bacterium]
MAHYRLLAIHAHPDDEASKGAATMARYSAEGHDVMVATLTGGERGSVLNSTITDPKIFENLQEVRVAEMAKSAEILGVQHRWVGFVDSGLPEGDPLPPLPEGSFATLDVCDAVEPLVRLIREFRPHVLMTYDERGGYPHPDHIQTHKASMLAWHIAGNPQQFPDSGEPWAPYKFYYDRNLTKERFAAFHNEMVKRGMDSPYADLLSRWGKNRETGYDRVTTFVECADYFPHREAALKAHATQVDPGSSFFFAPIEIQQAAWPVENFELAATRVPVTVPENGLFTGIPEN